MAYFPNQVMPKRLRKETQYEVDDSPLIYNARDYNIHHREIRAIQRSLIGSSVEARDAEYNKDTTSETLTQGSIIQASTKGGNSITDIVELAVQLLDLMINRGYIGQYSGTIQSGGQVKLPTTTVSTQTNGQILAADTSISVVDASNFPQSGVITKFNRLDSETSCSDGVAPVGGRCGAAEQVVGYDGLLSTGFQATNQEIISYTSRTSTAFNGCTRSVDGSTAQDATNDQPAIIVCGRAAISFTHNFWAQGSDGIPNQFYLTHDALLKATANILGPGGRTRLGDSLQDHIEIAWLLSVSGHFEDVDIGKLFNIQE